MEVEFSASSFRTPRAKRSAATAALERRGARTPCGLSTRTPNVQNLNKTIRVSAPKKKVAVRPMRASASVGKRERHLDVETPVTPMGSRITAKRALEFHSAFVSRTASRRPLGGSSARTALFADKSSSSSSSSSRLSVTSSSSSGIGTRISDRTIRDDSAHLSLSSRRAQHLDLDSSRNDRHDLDLLTPSLARTKRVSPSLRDDDAQHNSIVGSGFRAMEEDSAPAVSPLYSRRGPAHDRAIADLNSAMSKLLNTPTNNSRTRSVLRGQQQKSIRGKVSRELAGDEENLFHFNQ